jgi:ABC-type transport system involved in cytochrome bd biosynthesis fused ATPase/permease subunit
MSGNEYIDKETLEELKPKEEKKKVSKPKKSGPSTFTQILNGDFLTKEFFLNNLTFIFFIMFLLLLVVGKGYYGKELSQEINQTQKDLDEMTADFVEAKAKLEEETRRYKLREKLEPKGLKETTNQTKVIRLKKKNDE